MFQNEFDARAYHGFIDRSKGMFSYHGWGSVCRDENGTLYAVCSAFRAQHICPFGKTAMYISRDEGASWTPPIVINDTALDDRDAGILYLGNGRLLVSWFCHSAASYKSNYQDAIIGRGIYSGVMREMLESWNSLSPEDAAGGSFLRLSRDYGKTWEETIRVPVSSPHGPSMLADGSLIYAGVYHPANYMGRRATTYFGLYKCAGPDSLTEWTHLCDIKSPPGFEHAHAVEPTVIETGDGLLCAIRMQGSSITPTFRVFTCVSGNGGQSWSKPRDTGIQGSPPQLLRHSSGALILSYGRRIEPFGERAAVSYDDGHEWRDDYIIFDDAPSLDLGYPSTTELSDGRLLTVYYQSPSPEEKPAFCYSIWSLRDK